MHTVRTSLSLMGAALRSGLAYRQSFWLTAFGTFLLGLFELAGVFVVYQHVVEIQGWGLWEVVFMGGLAMIPFSLAHLLEAGLDQVPALVRSGEFDRILVRPVSPLIQVMSSKVIVSGLAQTAQGVIAVAVALAVLRPEWDAVKVLVVLGAMVGGFLVYLGLFVASAAASLWTVERIEAFNMFTYGGVTMSQYPVAVYQPWLRLVFLYLIPVAFVTYYPALVVLEHPDPMGLPLMWAGFAPVVGLAFFLACAWLWRRGIDHYQSTGS